MSEEENLKTNVKGYFNPNTWPVHVAISELNLSIRLQPMEFILDRRTGRKINDPILDRYVGPKLLRPEVVDRPLDVLRLPIPTQAGPVNPGYVVGQGHKDATGKWQPPTAATPLTATAPSGAPLVSVRDSVTGMSIEEARRRGLIGKPRLVPEDYGASEKDGAPVEGAQIPRIRYSMESRPKAAAAQPSATPAEWKKGMDPKVAPILQGLEAAAAADPETVDMSRRAAERIVEQQQGAAGVQQFRQTVKALKKVTVPAAVPAPLAAGAIPKRRRIAQVITQVPPPQVPPPQVPPPAQIATPGPVESPIVAGRDFPEPDVEEQPKGPITKADREALPIKCGGCGREFQYNSWYVRHVKSAHRDRLAELLPHEHP